MVPVLHGVYKNGWYTQNQQMGITWVLITLALNVLGATAYALKVCLTSEDISEREVV